MNRQTSFPRFLLAALICLAASAAQAAFPPPSNAPTKGSSILPKSAQLLMVETPGNPSKSNDIDSFDWPQTVRAVNGRWVQIADSGGYALAGKAPASRWVRKDDVVLLGPSPNGVLDNFTGNITTAERPAGSQPASPNPQQTLARQYWLRGIYWQTSAENNGGDDQDLAYADFKIATQIDPSLADAWLRRGKMAAQLEPSNLFGEDGWALCFAQAYTLYVNATASANAGCCSKSQVTPCISAVGANVGAPGVVILPSPSFYSPKCPPQLYLELGLAYELYYQDLDKGLCELLIAAEANLDFAQDMLNAAAKRETTAETAAKKAMIAGQALDMAKDVRAKVCDALADFNVACAPESVDPPIADGLQPSDAASKAIKDADDAVTHARTGIGDALGAIGNARLQLQASFDTAAAFFGLAQQANQDWFQPGSALGDLYLARAEAPIGDLDDKNKFNNAGMPCVSPNADDLLRALCAYESSIRLNDQNDESLRGRAKVLRYLAMPKLSWPRVVAPQGMLGRQLAVLSNPNSGRTAKAKAKAEVLDAAYVSAKAASSAANDRNPEDLEIRAQIETQLAFNLEPNISVEYLGQAQETLRQASWYSRSTVDRNRRNDLLFNAAYLSRWQLAGYASQNDTRFQNLRRDAQKLNAHVDAIWNVLGASSIEWNNLDESSTRYIHDLALATARAQRAISEINELEPPSASQSENAPGAAAPPAPPTASATASVINPAAGTTVSARAAVQNQNASTPAPRTDKAPVAYSGQPWPDDQLAMRFELNKRFSRLQAWEYDLVNFCRKARDSRRSRCPGALQTALKNAAKVTPTCGSDCD